MRILTHVCPITINVRKWENEMKLFLAIFFAITVLQSCESNGRFHSHILEIAIKKTTKDLELVVKDYQYIAHIVIRNTGRNALCIPSVYLPYADYFSPAMQLLFDEQGQKIMPIQPFMSFEYPNFSYVIIPPNEQYSFEIPIEAYFDFSELNPKSVYRYGYIFLGVDCSEFDDGFPNDDVSLLPDNDIYLQQYNLVRAKNATILDTGLVDFQVD